MNPLSRSIAILASLLILATAAADDWPGWRGPTRDGQSKEANLLDKWPDGGPQKLWSVTGIGAGYSSVAVSGDQVFVTGLEGKIGVLSCFGTDGKRQWRTEYGPEFAGKSFRRRRPGAKPRFAGARTTAAVHDGRVYILSGQGQVSCHDARTGQIQWKLDVLKTFGGQNLKWGISESLLIEDGKLIVTPGGPKASVVALEPATGKVVWKTAGLSSLSAYCSPMAVDHGKVRMIITHTADHLVGIAPKDGAVLWQHPYRNMRAIHPVTPIYHDGYVFATSGYGHGAVVVKLNEAGTKATEVWRKKILDTHHGGLVQIGGHVYGTSSTRPKGKWMCIEIATGEVKYEVKGVGKGAVIAAGDKLYCYGEDGTVALVKATPEGFTPISRFTVTAGEEEHWAHPAIAAGVLYIRHGDTLAAYKISK